MTNKSLQGCFVLVSTFILVCAVGALGVEVQFDFDGDLNATFGTATLDYYNDWTTSTAVTFGTAASLSLPALAGGDATVISLPAFAQDQGLLLDPACGPNGGGDYLNQYTMIWDMLVPDVTANWLSLYNTNSTNSNDGDSFIRPDGGIGIGGVYEGTVNSNQWHRIAIVWDVDSMYKYIDGDLVGSQLGISGVDGRWSMYTAGHDVDTFLLTDDNGDTNPSFINSFYFTDQPLAASVIKSFGGPSAGGPVPEPATILLLALGSFAIRRNRK